MSYHQRLIVNGIALVGFIIPTSIVLIYYAWQAHGYSQLAVVDAFSIFGGNHQLVVFAVLLLLFLLGFFLDFLEICFIIIPIMMPILKAMHIDPLWMGIMIAINLQTSFLTPPFGFALFYLIRNSPTRCQNRDIYRGIIPFVCMQLIVLALIWLFPTLATWLPRAIF